MALNFPDNPSLNDIYRDSTSGFNYQWNGTVWKSFSDQVVDEIKVLDDVSGSFNGNTTTFALASNSSAITPVNAQQLRIVLGGVVQKPATDYTVSSSNITFTTAPTSGLTFSGVSFGSAVPINNLEDGAVTPAKLSTGGPTWNASGDLNVAGILTTGGNLNAGGNLHVSGIATATTVEATTVNISSLLVGAAATFTGLVVNGTGTFDNISVGGTLSYQDVTSINSTGIVTATTGLHVLANGADIVGVLTARSGIRVGAGESISAVSGIITYYGDGSQLTGIDASSLKDSGSAIRVQANTSGAVVTGVLTATTLGVSTVTATEVSVTTLDASTSVEVGAGVTIHGTNGITLNQGTNASQIINPLLVNYAEKVNAMGTLSASETIDVKDGTYVTATLSTSATTINFISPPSGRLYGFALALTNASSGSAVSISWNTGGTGVKWPGGSVPTRTETNSKTDIWSFFTADGGTNWYGALSLFNFS
tara:strand:- start:871 stop:2310 length:1440 start_codon:yes stop_codon:yes gene_type:complete